MITLWWIDLRLVLKNIFVFTSAVLDSFSRFSQTYFLGLFWTGFIHNFVDPAKLGGLKSLLKLYVLEVKSPVLFDFIVFSLFLVLNLSDFRKILLHFFFLFRYNFSLRVSTLDLHIARKTNFDVDIFNLTCVKY